MFWCCGCLLWWLFKSANWGCLQEKVVNFFCNVYVSVVCLNSAILWQMLLWIHQSCRCPGCLTILVEVWITAMLGWNGCWSRDLRNFCVLVNCLLKSFQCHSKFPSNMCVVIIQECLVGCVCRTGWKRPILQGPSEMNLW